MIEFAWLLPILPFVVFLIIGLGTLQHPRLSALIAIIGMAGCFVMALGIAYGVWSQGVTMDAPVEYSLQWLNLPGITIEAGILIDPLTAVMLVVVCTIALLVEIYSWGYMHDDPGFARYYAYISFFVASMLGLVVANNYFQIFFFWELVGLCSYLLIGFYFGKKSAVQANQKAFLFNRVADFGFMLGFFTLFGLFGTFNFGELALVIPEYANTVIITLAALLVFVGPVGKSAQFPLHVWLPDAMEGPTPVSALIHAATMVAAGVYLLARQFVLFSASPTAMLVIAYTGGFTALFAASIALVNTDIKRILAFSTISQLGYMVMAIGCGSMTAGTFHLTTHAFFKALLFLGAGSVIHAVGSNEIGVMGGLYKKMPITTWTFIIGSLALAGIFPLAGFWSKDEILVTALDAGHMPLYILGLVVAFMTAFYMFRLIFIAFFGEQRGDAHLHESPRSMTFPLIFLAVCSVFVGFVGAPFLSHGYASFVYYGEPHHAVANYGVMIASTIVALAGIGLAWLMYGKKVIDPAAIKRASGPIYGLLQNRYYLDEVYQWIFDHIALGFSRAFNWCDRTVVDGTVDGMTDLTKNIGAKLRLLQTGQVQTYALVMFLAIVVMVVAQQFFLMGGV